MRTKEHFESEISACADLTIIQRIPADQLEQLEVTYAMMLQAVRDALEEHKRIEAQHEAIKLELVASKKSYHVKCSELLRSSRENICTLAELAAANKMPQYMTKTMLEQGRAVERAGMADQKKEYIINLYRDGVGVRPAARLVAKKFGNCSASYAAKIIKAYKEKTMPQLPLSVLRSIK